jgi:hypothetical protein
MRNQYATHTDFRDFQGLIPENTHFLPSNIDMILREKGTLSNWGMEKT